jgi:hypothetical protein
MSYTLDDFRRDNKRFVLEQVKQNLELLVKEIPSEDLVKHLSSEARLQGLSVAEIEAYLAKMKKKS